MPEVMALSPPGLPQSRDELPVDLVVFFENGVNTAFSAHSREKETVSPEDIASTPPQIRKCTWLLSRLLVFDSTDDRGLLAATWHRIYGQKKNLGTYFSHQRFLPYKIERYKEMQIENQSLEKIQKAERDYLRDNVHIRVLNS